jgi:hypothetical protein
MSLSRFYPEIILFGMILLFQSDNPGPAPLLVQGLLKGALIGALWCSFEREWSRADLSKLKHILSAAMGAAPLVSGYLAFGPAAFTAEGVDQMMFRNWAGMTQAERDVSLMSVLGAIVGIVTMRAFDR